MRFTKYATRILALLQEGGMGQGKTIHRFATLCAVVLPLLSTPNSNADNERVFSMVEKIDSDSRSDLGQGTICCKLNTIDSITVVFSFSLQTNC